MSYTKLSYIKENMAGFRPQKRDFKLNYYNLNVNKFIKSTLFIFS